MGMYGKDYAWILIGQPEKLWWTEGEDLGGDDINNDPPGSQQRHHNGNSMRKISVPEVFMSHVGAKSLDCKMGEVAAALERTLIVDRYNFIGNGTTSDSGMVSSIIVSV